MSWLLILPFSEAAKYRSQLDEVFAKHGRNYQGKFAMMRHTSVLSKRRGQTGCYLRSPQCTRTVWQFDDALRRSQKRLSRSCAFESTGGQCPGRSRHS